MSDSTTIDYQHFFYELLEAAPWPVIIIDRNQSICFYNQLSVQLLEPAEPMQGLRLDQVVHDQAILQVVQDSISADQPRKAEHTKDASGTAWKVTVTPLEHAERNMQG